MKNQSHLTKLHTFIICVFSLQVCPWQSSLLLAQRPPTQDSSALRRGDRIDAAQELLKSHLASAEGELKQLDARVLPLKEEVQKLLNELEAVEVQEEQADPPPAKAPREIVYRPPMERATSKDPGPMLVCENGRITVFDVNDTASPDGHFETKEIIAGFVVEYVRKPGDSHLGETPQEIESQTSGFQEFLRRYDFRKSYVQCCVYPDSYDCFLAARTFVWSQKFEVRWLPMHPRQKLMGGGGRGRVQ